MKKAAKAPALAVTPVGCAPAEARKSRATAARASSAAPNEGRREAAV